MSDPQPTNDEAVSKAERMVTKYQKIARWFYFVATVLIALVALYIHWICVALWIAIVCTLIAFAANKCAQDADKELQCLKQTKQRK